jgi:hypothetical protein
MESEMADSPAAEPPLSSPFALMFPGTSRKIAQRAAALELPSRLCSPLAMQRAPGRPDEDDDHDD